VNKVQIRDAIVGHLEVLLQSWETAGNGIFCDMENSGTLDLGTVGDEFLCFYIAWSTTKQTNIASNPDHRYYGDVVILIFGKDGTGTRKRLGLEDEISEHFKFKALGGVQLREPTPSTAPGRFEQHQGWSSSTVTFPFFADSNS
jgi:hypothetical protein